MQFMLDTNICIYIAKKKPIEILQRFERLTVGQVGMSSITYGELLYGVHKSQHPQKNMRILQKLTELIVPLPISPKVSLHYGQARCFLENGGTLIGNNDLWIAAHALAESVTLVTNNIKEFSRIPHLKYENWI